MSTKLGICIHLNIRMMHVKGGHALGSFWVKNFENFVLPPATILSTPLCCFCCGNFRDYLCQLQRKAFPDKTSYEVFNVLDEEKY